MKYEDLPEETQEEIDGLKYGSYTIETEVQQALDEAGSVEDFKAEVKSRMEALIAEATDVMKLLGE